MSGLEGKAKQHREAADAGPAQGLATETPSSTAGGADTTAVADQTRDTSICGDCGSEEVIYVTKDPAAEEVGYCKTHLPANVTAKMVEEQGR